MSSSTSLASARRRKGVTGEQPGIAHTVQSGSMMSSMMRISKGRTTADPPPRPKKHNAPERQQDPKAIVTREFTGIGDVAKFEPVDNIRPVTKNDGSVMFTLGDIVKIHEKKLVQHETALSNQMKTVGEIEEQTLNCINELDAKCETLFHDVQQIKEMGPNADEVKAEIQRQFNTHAKSDTHPLSSASPASSAPGVESLRAQLDETTELYNKLYADHKAVLVDVNYLKQMMLNVQSSYTETNRTVMKLMHASPVASLPPPAPPPPKGMGMGPGDHPPLSFENMSALDKVAALSKMNAIKDLQQNKLSAHSNSSALTNEPADEPAGGSNDVANENEDGSNDDSNENEDGSNDDADLLARPNTLTLTTGERTPAEEGASEVATPPSIIRHAESETASLEEEETNGDADEVLEKEEEPNQRRPSHAT